MHSNRESQVIMDIDLDTRVSYVYHSNMLDGVSLSEGQTRSLLEGTLETEDGGLVMSPSGREYEPEVVTSHWNAVYFVTRLAESTADITESTLREIHRRLMADVILSNGDYREVDLKVKGFLIASPAGTISERMDRFIRLLNVGYTKASDKAGFAWRVHHEFITIHPFIAANGRMARLLLNLIRLKAEMPLETVSFEDLAQYQRSILEYQRSKLEKAGIPVPESLPSTPTDSQAL